MEETSQELIMAITQEESKVLFDRAIALLEAIYEGDPFKDFILSDDLGRQLQLIQHYISCNNHWYQKEMISEADYTYRLRLATQSILLLGYLFAKEM